MMRYLTDNARLLNIPRCAGVCRISVVGRVERREETRGSSALPIVVSSWSLHAFMVIPFARSFRSGPLTLLASWAATLEQTERTSATERP